jgi:O-methyltransferase involved in polyketide biosynthesis
MTHERISPTAWLVAYQRTFSDIPFSNEIFHELHQIIQQTRTAPETDSVEAPKASLMGLIWEARFKIVNHALKAHHADQILEIAAGFSPRGLNLAQDASLTYVELDLPGVIQDKQRIIETLVGS